MEADCMLILTCKKDGQQWVTTGKRTEDDNITLISRLLVPGGKDDPTVCPLCQGTDVGVNVIGILAGK